MSLANTASKGPQWQSLHDRFEQLAAFSFEKRAQGWAEYRQVTVQSKPGQVRVVRIQEAERHGPAVNKPHRPLEARIEFTPAEQGLRVSLASGYSDEAPRQRSLRLPTVNDEKMVTLLESAFKRNMPLTQILGVIEKLHQD